MKGKRIVRIENWEIMTSISPEVSPYLRGNVYDHPRFDNGDLVNTSKITGISKDRNDVETHNSLYILLGDPKHERDIEMLETMRRMHHGEAK